MRHIAIIGSGPTAIYTAKHLLTSAETLKVTMFEQQEQAGKGTPYHQDWNDSEMLSNIASIELPPVMETLIAWLERSDDQKLAGMGVTRAELDDRAFYPRVVLGEYFHDQLLQLTQHANALEIRLNVKTCHKVLDASVEERGVRLTVEQYGSDIYPAFFDYAVMATGHAWPKETETKPGYFLSPWPAASLQTIGNCPVGIRGTSLSAIDAMVALAVARGTFRRGANSKLEYLAEPGTEAFHITMMSRKGVLPEADFYHPIPYEPLSVCTPQAVQKLILAGPSVHLLDEVYDLFKQELALSDPEYAKRIKLSTLSLAEFSQAYFKAREKADPFEWAEENLKEAKQNQESRITVPWRYAILRMHEVIARIVPNLFAEDYERFNRDFKPIFVDDYATVPHESIERLLAMHDAGKLEVLSIGSEYELNTENVETGATLLLNDEQLHFPAFIEATGQRPLSLRDFPFPGLWKQGLLHKAKTPYYAYDTRGNRPRKSADIGGIDLDIAYHPVSDSPYASRLYCLSLPFMLGQFPFAQGITSSYEMGKKVAEDMMLQFAKEEAALHAA